MSRALVLLGLLSVLDLTSQAAMAELQWERTVRSYDRTPEDEAIEATFPFKNSGNTPVTIKNLRSSCGCTTAKLDKRTYLPGESGEVTLRFSFGGRRDLQVKGVSVTTDDNTDPVTLTLRVKIADTVKFDPEFVWWRVGAAPVAKRVGVWINPDIPVQIKAVRSSNPQFTARLEILDRGTGHEIVITPKDTAGRGAAEIEIVTNFPSDSPRSFTLHARIK